MGLSDKEGLVYARLSRRGRISSCIKIKVRPLLTQHHYDEGSVRLDGVRSSFMMYSEWGV